MPDRESDKEEDLSSSRKTETEEENSSDDDLVPDRFIRKKIDIVRELQIFFKSKGFADLAEQIQSEKHARQLFTKAQMDMFRNIFPTKHWHIRPPSDSSWNDYQCLSIYLPNGRNNFCRDYCYYHFTYDFDCAYLKFAEDLWGRITWTTTESDARPIAEAIWKKHMPDDVESELLEDCISGAVTHSRAKKSLEELASLCFDLYRREVAGMDFVQALKEIIAENGLDPYPLNKIFIEEAIEKHEGRIWSMYRRMKRCCNIEKRGALKENELMGLITDHFKSFLIISSRDYYAEYVKVKIRYAEELGIV